MRFTRGLTVTGRSGLLKNGRNTGNGNVSAAILLPSLGGIVAFISAMLLLMRAILRSVNAIKDNTEALEVMHRSMIELNGTVSQHTVDIAILQDRQSRRR